MVILIVLNFANASLGFYEATKAEDAVEALKKQLKPEATVKRDGKWINMDATMIVPGDLVLLSSGGSVPADVRNHGCKSTNTNTELAVDQSSLTGESLPVTLYRLDQVKQGSTVVAGEAHATVEFTGVNTFLGKTASMIESGTKSKSNMQRMVSSHLVSSCNHYYCKFLDLMYH